MKTKQKNKSIFIFCLVFLGLLIIGFNRWPVASGQGETAINAEIQLLNEEIQRQKEYLDEINKKRQTLETLMKGKQQEAASLNNQLTILEGRITQAELEIESTEIEIATTNLEIQKLKADKMSLDRKIEQQKDHISRLMRLTYRQSQLSTLEILLLNDSLTDFLNQLKYLDSANREISEKVNELKINKDKLDRSQEILEEKSRELGQLIDRLNGQINGLEYEKQSKVFILEETQSSEKEYQSLVAQAKREQQQASAEIANLEVTVRQKLASLQNNRLEDSDSTIGWPMTKNVVTATFRDPGYPYRHLIGEHSGIDIRSAQGNTLRAAADGYVARVKFAGTSAYAYIMIIHNDGLSTVYGHVSAVNVEADQYVVRGQVIGKTGGAPGGVGSGAFSTGPHLHFEVRKNGLPVNPLDYLP